MGSPNRNTVMKRLFNLLCAAAALLLICFTASAYEWKNGNEVWTFDTHEDGGELVAYITGYRQVDKDGYDTELPDNLAITVPATVTVTWTNELGHLENVFETGNYVSNKFVTTFGPEVMTETIKIVEVYLFNFSPYMGLDESNGKLISVTFPDSVVWVGGFNCTNLTDVTLSDGARFDGGAFIGSPWLKGKGDFVVRDGELVAYQGTSASVTVPDNVVAIGDYAFSAYLNTGLTNLTSVTLPEGIDSIGYYAFSGCGKLSSINLPDTLTSIDACAFEWCTSLADVNLPAGLEYLGGYSLCGTAISSIVVPKYIEGIAYGAFSDCSELTSVTFLSPIEEIGDYAFDACPALASITIPDSVRRIGDCAFNGAKSLTKIDLPDSLERIGYSAFKDCTKLATVTGGENVREMGSDVFADTALYNNVVDGIVQAGTLVVGYNGTLPAALEIPNGATYVACAAFWYNSDITSLVLPASVHTIDDCAFYNCSALATVTGGDGVQRISIYDAFGLTPYGDSITNNCDNAFVQFAFVRLGSVILGYQGVCPASIVIPDGVTQIYPRLFNIGDGYITPSNITSVTIGADVMDIGDDAFNGLENLVTVTGGGAVEYVGSLTFAHCPKLTDVSLKGPMLRLEPAMFYQDFNLVNVAFDLVEPEDDNEFFLGTSIFNDCDKLASVTVTFDGYTLEGWEAMGPGPAFEFFDDELATYRLNYKEWYSSEDWYPALFTLRPIWSGGIEPEPAPEPQKPDGPVQPVEPSVPGKADEGSSLVAISHDVHSAAAVSAAAPVAEVVEEAASVYEGYLYDASGALKGTVEVKASKAKNGASKVTATIQVLGAKKQKVSGNMDIATGVLSSGDLTLKFDSNGMTGRYGVYEIDGARSMFASKDSGDKSAAAAILSKWQGAVNVAWEGGALTVMVAAKGKTKVAGSLSDGTKVSASGQLVVGDAWCCVPVVVAKGKVTLSFALWLSTDGGVVEVAGLTSDAVAGKPGSLKNGAAFKVDAASVVALVSGAQADYLPVGVAVTGGTKWTLPKAGSVAYKNGAFDTSKAGDNPSGLKLTYTSKNGSFKGSFNVYTLVGGKLKKVKADATGVLVNGVGYGSATIKKVGSVRAMVE